MHVGTHARTYDDTPEGATEDGGYEEAVEAGNEGKVEMISDVQRQQLNTRHFRLYRRFPVNNPNLCIGFIL